MTIRNITKNIAALFIFLCMGVFAGVAVTQYLFETLPMMNPSTVPENPVAIIIIPFMALVLCIIVTVILSVMLFVLKKHVKISFLLFKKEELKRCIALRVIGYLLVVRLIYESIRDWLEFKQFFISGLLYYTSSVIFILLGMIILIAIITKKEN